MLDMQTLAHDLLRATVDAQRLVSDAREATVSVPAAVAQPDTTPNAGRSYTMLDALSRNPEFAALRLLNLEAEVRRQADEIAALRAAEVAPRQAPYGSVCPWCDHAIQQTERATAELLGARWLHAACHDQWVEQDTDRESAATMAVVA